MEPLGFFHVESLWQKNGIVCLPSALNLDFPSLWSSKSAPGFVFWLV